MYINGFNFDNDWNDIYNYLENQHHIYNNYLNDPVKTYTYIDEFGIEHIIFITQEKFKNFQKILYKNLKKFKYSFVGYKGEDLSQFRMTISKQFDFDNSIFPLVNYQLEYFGGTNETPKSYCKIIKELENLIGITL